MSSFRFGELRERSLHKQLKALYCPADGQPEWPMAGAVADLWSPTQGVIEIQTRTLYKLRPKIAAYLESGLRVTVVFPVAARRVLVTWNADRTEILSRRKSPKRERVEGAFREIGTLAPFLIHDRFTLLVLRVHETEHRCADGMGSWRRQGRSRVDRVLDEVIEERSFRSRDDYRALIPDQWPDPGTAKELAQHLALPSQETQPLISCFKKLGVLEVCGQRGRAPLLRRVPADSSGDQH